MLATIVVGAMLSVAPAEVPPTYWAHQINDEEHRTYAGNYELTAYTWTGNPCADGVYPREGVTVASNDSSLWHKCVYIEGYGVFFVHDTGGMSNNVIDIYMDSYDACIEFGRRAGEVYIIE